MTAFHVLLSTMPRFLGSLFGSRPSRTPTVPRPPRRRRLRVARAGVLWFAFALVALNVGALYLLALPQYRDPEYGRRAVSLRQRLRENPGRPLTVVIGSSRAAMGVRPGEWESTRPNDPASPDPLLFNLSTLGGGPVMELMTVRRLYADGFRPDVILLEFWPPFLHWDGGWEEPARIPADRLRWMDRPVVGDYFSDPERLEREMVWRRTSPLFANRERLLVQALPRWLPHTKRIDWSWDDMDGWGWKPGSDLAPGLGAERDRLHGACADIYRPLFENYRVSKKADRAFRETVRLAKANGAAVGFVFLPESSEFRKQYPERVSRLAREHLDAMSRDLDVPVIDCRKWMDDAFIVDGFHLSRTGASEFTRKFGPAVASAFAGPSPNDTERVQP